MKREVEAISYRHAVGSSATIDGIAGYDIALSEKRSAWPRVGRTDSANSIPTRVVPVGGTSRLSLAASCRIAADSLETEGGEHSRDAVSMTAQPGRSATNQRGNLLIHSQRRCVPAREW